MLAACGSGASSTLADKSDSAGNTSEFSSFSPKPSGNPPPSSSVTPDATQARFKRPIGIAIDVSGNVYVADAGNNTVRKLTPAGNVTTLAGSAGVSGTADGTGAAARFSFLKGIAVDKAGN